MGTDDVVCVDSGVMGCCYPDCVFGAKVAVLAVSHLYTIILLLYLITVITVVTILTACGKEE